MSLKRSAHRGVLSLKSVRGGRRQSVREADSSELLEANKQLEKAVGLGRTGEMLLATQMG